MICLTSLFCANTITDERQHAKQDKQAHSVSDRCVFVLLKGTLDCCNPGGDPLWPRGEPGGAGGGFACIASDRDFDPVKEPKLDDTDIPSPPEPLGEAGAALWNAVLAEHELRPDEIAVLCSAAKLADAISAMEKAMVGQSLIAKGSMGQPVANPLLVELRHHRATQAALLRQLRLTEEDEDAEPLNRPMSRTEAARKAALARWRKAAA
jgi:hypothetical protein